MRNKLQLLTAEEQKLTKATMNAEEAPTARVAAQEQCKRIVVDFAAYRNNNLTKLIHNVWKRSSQDMPIRMLRHWLFCLEHP